MKKLKNPFRKNKDEEINRVEGQKTNDQILEESKKKEINVIKIWWVSMLVIPLFLFSLKFIPMQEIDRFVWQWALILVLSLLVQIFWFNKGIPYGRKMIHVLFIVFTIITTMFVTYFVSRYVHIDIENTWEGIDFLLLTLIQSVILAVFKITYWLTLVMHYENIEGKKNRIQTLEEENIVLNSQLGEYKKLAEKEKEKFLKEINDLKHENKKLLNPKEEKVEERAK